MCEVEFAGQKCCQYTRLGFHLGTHKGCPYGGIAMAEGNLSGRCHSELPNRLFWKRILEPEDFYKAGVAYAGELSRGTSRSCFFHFID